MADDTLSQDEIDELLNIGDEAGGGASGGDADPDDLDLDSLLGGGGDAGGGDMGGAGDGTLDAAAMDALAGALGAGGSPASGGDGAPAARGGHAPHSMPDNSENVVLLLDVNLRFSVELGQTMMRIKDVLQLGESSVVELDKNVGDEVDILINDRLFGRGKLVVIDEYFGVQITHILDGMDRFRGLQ